MLAYMPSVTYMPTYICKHICKINVYVCGSIYVTYMTYMKMAQFHICGIYVEYMYMYVTCMWNIHVKIYVSYMAYARHIYGFYMCKYTSLMRHIYAAIHVSYMALI